MTMLVRGGAVTGPALPATATTGQVLQWNGTAWVPATPSASGTTPNATPTVPGLVQLAGDLGGTATAPTVAKINGAAPAAVATSGNYTDLTGRPALAAVATSGNYTDLTSRPALATVATSGAYTDLTGRPALATVATSGSYGDLTGRPLLATVATTGSYADLTGAPTVPLMLAKTTTTTTTTTTPTLDAQLVTSLAVGTYAVEVLTQPAAGNVASTTTSFGGTATVTGGAVANSGSAASNLSSPSSTVNVGPTSHGSITGSITCTAAGTFGLSYVTSSNGSQAGVGPGSWLRLTRLF